jgi:putative ABC transport system permease protein
VLKNYLLVAVRSFRRRLGFATINVLGLGVGIACCAVIALYVWGELSYDRFHEDAEHIYRIESVWGGGVFSLPATNWRFVEALRTEQPDLRSVAMVRSTNQVVRRDEVMFREPAMLFAEPAFFDVFSFHLERGDEATALEEPYTMILTSEMADKYFGSEDPMGQILTMFASDQEFTVTGVLAPSPGPTHIPHDPLISFQTLEALGWTATQHWGNNSVNTYLRFSSAQEAEGLAAMLPDIIERHAGENWNESELDLQRLTDIHLHSNHSAELSAGGNPAYVTLFSIVALFILLLAGVNFVNLSTARSLERAREVGVRKSMGAFEGQLSRQFLAEAVLLALAGLVIAVLLVALVVPMLTGLVGRPLMPNAQTFAVAAAVAIVLTLLVGVGGGLYPAFALARFKPAEVLRGRFSAGRGGVRLRQGLVVFQFAVAVVLLIGTFVVHGQLRHMQTADLGFDQSQVLAVQGPGVGTSSRLAFFEALSGEASIESVSSTNQPMPTELLDGYGTFLQDATPPESMEEAPAMSLRGVFVSADFFETLGAEFLAGRDFRAGSPADSAGLIVNRSGAHALMAQAPERFDSIEELLGETVVSSGTRQIVGIVEDFHMASLHKAIDPIAFHYGHAGATYLVRVAPGSVSPAVAALSSHWGEHFPQVPLQYHFVDDAFAMAYAAERQLSILALLFAGLAILVACLGLFGLAAYAAEARRKEIGVRKVLGASVASVVTLLSKEFVRLVAIAVVVGAPVAYFGVSRWLEAFPSRVELGPGPFLLAGALAVLIALITVSGQALRAATSDPVKSIRME